MSETQRKQAPWHLWLIGVIALFWNAMGALDYFLTQSKSESYMKLFTSAQLEFFHSFPSWSVAL